MERILSQEERLKRAEEIYYRRKNSISAPKTATVNISTKKNYKFLKKIIVQIIICMCIYGAIYNLQSNTDSFSIDSINYLKDAIAYDIDINKTFEGIKQYLATFKLTNDDNEVVENNVIENAIEEKTQTSSNLIEATLAVSENVEENITPEPTEEASSVSQMEQDAEYIKSNFSFIKPLTTGTVTSRFGLRNPTTATVPKYHTGIDIGVPEGTVIVSAMEGTVELVSSVGDYRKSHKNNKWGRNDFICTLQNNLCITRRQGITRAANRGDRKHRKRNRPTPTL